MGDVPRTGMTENDFKQSVLLELANIRVGIEKRLTYLETHDTEIHGNGQRGWKKETEQRLNIIERYQETEVTERKTRLTIVHLAWASAVVVVGAIPRIASTAQYLKEWVKK